LDLLLAQHGVEPMDAEIDEISEESHHDINDTKPLLDKTLGIETSTTDCGILNRDFAQELSVNKGLNTLELAEEFTTEELAEELAINRGLIVGDAEETLRMFHGWTEEITPDIESTIQPGSPEYDQNLLPNKSNPNAPEAMVSVVNRNPRKIPSNLNPHKLIHPRASRDPSVNVHNFNMKPTASPDNSLSSEEGRPSNFRRAKSVGNHNGQASSRQHHQNNVQQDQVLAKPMLNTNSASVKFGAKKPMDFPERRSKSMDCSGSKNSEEIHYSNLWGYPMPLSRKREQRRRP